MLSSAVKQSDKALDQYAHTSIVMLATKVKRSEMWTLCRMVQEPEKLKIPTLLIWGGDDAALGPQLAHQVPQFVEDVEVHILDQCSHWAQQDR